MYCTASTGRCAHLHDRMLNKPTNYQQRTPYPCVRVVYIAGDTLRHQPMGASHMTMLQLRGPMGSCVLPWWLFIAGDTLCHQPMGASHMTVPQLCGLWDSVSCNGVTQCLPAQRGQAVVSGSLPCMVHGSGFRPATECLYAEYHFCNPSLVGEFLWYFSWILWVV